MSSELFELAGRVAIVTGGNSGLGRALALALRDAGARVVIAGRRAERNAEVQKALGDGALSYEADVSDEASVEGMVQDVARRCGRIDILVNNAGQVNRASVMQLELAAWERVLSVNLTGAFLCTKHVARVMAAAGAGKIINIASVYGVVAPSKGLQAAYTAAKHGLIGLTKANAVELAPLGIQVNAIAPGYFLTEMTAELSGTSLERAIIRRTPSGKWGAPSALVGTCIYLASAASDHVAGECIVVDGGYLASDGLDRG
ncbi:MAG TPA: SDR family oxidoreductase [Burkholderiales bacterium]|nr:SDR family oxidoreductase [Burkholderiales bacterium]